jgi:hypothetical protein
MENHGLRQIPPGPGRRRAGINRPEQSQNPPVMFYQPVDDATTAHEESSHCTALKKTPPSIFYNSVIYFIVKFSSITRIFSRRDSVITGRLRRETADRPAEREFILKKPKIKSIKKTSPHQRFF